MYYSLEVTCTTLLYTNAWGQEIIYIFKDMYTFIQQGCIKLTVNTFVLQCYKIFQFQINAVL